MHVVARWFLPAAILATLTGFPGRATADPIALYTFEQLPVGTLTPVLDLAADAGPASMLASFTFAPIYNPSAAFGISNFQPNSLFSGNSFSAVGAGGECAGCGTLTVALNTYVNHISVAFATNGPYTFRFTSPAGAASQMATRDGGLVGSFPGGMFTFGSSTPFNVFSLTAGKEFAIDNLSLTASQTAPVPEPGTMLLLGSGLVALSRFRRRCGRD
jgi:hypothetical protein